MVPHGSSRGVAIRAVVGRCFGIRGSGSVGLIIVGEPGQRLDVEGAGDEDVAHAVGRDRHGDGQRDGGCQVQRHGRGPAPRQLREPARAAPERDRGRRVGIVRNRALRRRLPAALQIYRPRVSMAMDRVLDDPGFAAVPGRPYRVRTVVNVAARVVPGLVAAVGADRVRV